jgi:hypothetical protein
VKKMEENVLIEYLEENSGYSYDTVIPEEIYEECKDLLEETSRTTVIKHFPDAKSYRDDNARKSVHLTDYRGLEREELESDVIVAHLERFNPEHHPVLHALIDFPIWYYKNRIREKNNL